jgi:hypothetical protein
VGGGGGTRGEKLALTSQIVGGAGHFALGGVVLVSLDVQPIGAGTGAVDVEGADAHLVADVLLEPREYVEALVALGRDDGGMGATVGRPVADLVAGYDAVLALGRRLPAYNHTLQRKGGARLRGGAHLAGLGLAGSIDYRGAGGLDGDVGRTRWRGSVGPDADLAGRGPGPVVVNRLHPDVVLLVGQQAEELVRRLGGVPLRLLVITLQVRRRDAND